MIAGQVIDGRFEIEGEVHVGNLSRVYRARDRSGEGGASSWVALKTPQGGHAATGPMLARFAAEAALLAELTSAGHPGIVRHVAHRTEADDPYLATEWLDGTTLQATLAARRLSVGDSLLVVRRIAEGLAVVHRAGVVHRDLKPGNLFLPGGNLEAVKILDFGIAQRDAGGRGLTAHVSFGGGTWAYMSPEQAMGSAEMGARTDVFSLGCVLFECLSGQAAYPVDRSAATMAKVFKDPPRLEDVCPGLPAAAVAVVGRMMAKDPTARPKHGGEVAAALAALPSR